MSREGMEPSTNEGAKNVVAPVPLTRLVLSAPFRGLMVRLGLLGLVAGLGIALPSAPFRGRLSRSSATAHGEAR